MVDRQLLTDSYILTLEKSIKEMKIQLLNTKLKATKKNS